jgi:GTP cyclohydrolase I
VQKSFKELFSGYGKDPKEIMKTFQDGSCDEMVVVRDIQFFSTCEHHMLPFFGTAHVAYIPNGKIVGLSKIPRLIEIFARRLQVQERLTEQITKAINEELQPKGVACVIHGTHLCMMARGVQQQQAKMTTFSLCGVFRDKPEARAEFFAAIK